MRRLILVAALLLACERSEPDASAQEPAASSQPWQVVEEAQLRSEIQAALARARSHDKQVLLEFVANWCSDCREVVRVSSLPPASEVIRSRYEKVFVNVGRFDKHRELINQYRIDRIATLVVLDGGGRRVAQTTLEPISHGRTLSPEALAQWLQHPTDRRILPQHRTPAKAEHSTEDSKAPRVFPPEVLDGE